MAVGGGDRSAAVEVRELVAHEAEQARPDVGRPLKEMLARPGVFVEKKA